MSDKRAVYRIYDLRSRYECSESTLRRWMAEKGFPKPFARGRWLKEAVLAWEQKVIPPLPTATNQVSGEVLDSNNSIFRMQA